MRHRKTADTTAFLWSEEGRLQQGCIAEVAPLLPLYRTYSFAVPGALEPMVRAGQRVRVPIGRHGRLVTGFVVSLDRGRWDSTLRPVDSLVDDDTFLTPDLLELGKEIAGHYACPLGLTLKAMVPEGVRRRRGLTTVRYARLAGQAYGAEPAAPRLTRQRKALLDRLAAAPGPVPVDRLLKEAGVSAGVLRALAKAGYVEIFTRKHPGDDEGAAAAEPPVEPPYALTAEQQDAVERIRAEIGAGRFSVTLLHGVSGSGKTEVYLRAIQRTVELGRQALLLVPEIVLTTQLVQRLAPRLPGLAVLHSGLTESERSRIWREVAAGGRNVVLGTRSAVFAPFTNPGLICVDEEQETSYKNLQAPRFHVRDVAILRAKQWNIPIVLGSATPALETWHNAVHRAHYRRVALPRRIHDRPMPRVHVIDMGDEFADLRRVMVLSRTAERLLGETLERGEQAMLLVNRRGFAHRIFCPRCKSRLVCPNCNVGLVAHTATGDALCHYCRQRMPTPTVCPSVACGERLLHVGSGTQRVEETLARRFPRARVSRVDSDTMRHRGAYERIISDFEARRIDVLVGTQMIAKGLDFPFVSFVCVVHADPVALSADFRSVERLFQLLTQVAGRAGRGSTGGEVVIQTTMPELPAIRYALQHDYAAFAADELRIRRKIGLPPYRRLARIVLSHPREETARARADSLAEQIREATTTLDLAPADLWGPNPCLLSRLRGKYRYELLLRAPGVTALRSLLRHLIESRHLSSRAGSVMLDVDPVSMM